MKLIKGKKVETLEELRKLDGKKVTCSILGDHVEEALVHIGESLNLHKNRVFILQDVRNGCGAKDKKGYKYSWNAGINFSTDLSNIYELIEEEEQDNDNKIYYEPKEGEYQFDQEGDFKPYAVYVSDVSEDEAVEQHSIITWYLGCRTLKGAYVTWDERYSTIEELQKRRSTDNHIQSWKYIVPVTKNKTSSKKQELQNRLKNLESEVKSIREELEEIE